MRRSVAATIDIIKNVVGGDFTQLEHNRHLLQEIDQEEKRLSLFP
jgi:hypothetical protein